MMMKKKIKGGSLLKKILQRSLLHVQQEKNAQYPFMCNTHNKVGRRLFYYLPILCRQIL